MSEQPVQAGMVRFVLVGKREGFSGYLGGGSASRHKFGFRNGVCTLPYQEAEMSRKILKFFAAYPEGSKELADAQASWEKQNGSTEAPSVSSPVQSDGPGVDSGATAQQSGDDEVAQGETGSVPERDRSERPSRAMKLTDALQLLDPSKEDHWTQDGKPKLVLLQQLLKDNTLKREEVDETGVTRETNAA